VPGPVFTFTIPMLAATVLLLWGLHSTYATFFSSVTHRLGNTPLCSWGHLTRCHPRGDTTAHPTGDRPVTVFCPPALFRSLLGWGGGKITVALLKN